MSDAGHLFFYASMILCMELAVFVCKWHASMNAFIFKNVCRKSIYVNFYMKKKHAFFFYFLTCLHIMFLLSYESTGIIGGFYKC